MLNNYNKISTTSSSYVDNLDKIMHNAATFLSYYFCIIYIEVRIHIIQFDSTVVLLFEKSVEQYILLLRTLIFFSNNSGCHSFNIFFYFVFCTYTDNVRMCVTICVAGDQTYNFVEIVACTQLCKKISSFKKIYTKYHINNIHMKKVYIKTIQSRQNIGLRQYERLILVDV